jgi:hypothetical protein
MKVKITNVKVEHKVFEVSKDIRLHFNLSMNGITRKCGVIMKDSRNDYLGRSHCVDTNTLFYDSDWILLGRETVEPFQNGGTQTRYPFSVYHNFEKYGKTQSFVGQRLNTVSFIRDFKSQIEAKLSNPSSDGASLTTSFKNLFGL